MENSGERSAGVPISAGYHTFGDVNQPINEAINADLTARSGGGSVLQIIAICSGFPAPETSSTEPGFGTRRGRRGAHLFRRSSVQRLTCLFLTFFPRLRDTAFLGTLYRRVPILGELIALDHVHSEQPACARSL
jgi:hypothetical protein